jgi:hypothetical protein
MLLWSLGLYVAHRRRAGSSEPAGGSGPSKEDKKDEMMTEAVRLYYAERDKLFHPPKDDDPKS